jgi:hypothetical protein
MARSKKKAAKPPAKQPSPQPSPPEDSTNVAEQEQQEDIQMELPPEPTGPEPPAVAEAAGQTIKNVAEPSGELVESTNGEDVENEKESKLSLEERKAKMEQLRAKMVSSSFARS